MGTNYYVHVPPACGGTCGIHCKDEKIHLGKSSAGWAFAFRAYPDPDPAYGPEAVTWPVKDYASWLKLLDLGSICDEYRQPVARDDLLALIENKRGGLNDHAAVFGEYLDPSGNRFIPREFS